MKVLQISNKIPYPEKDGGAIAINAITDGLIQSGCEVKLLAMNTKKHFIDIASIPEKFRNERHLEAVPIDTSVKPLDAFTAMLLGKSYNISRFESEDFRKRLIEILQKEKFDVIHLDGLFVALYLKTIRENSDAPTILRTHNVEWKIWKKLASEEKPGFKKWYLNKLTKQLRRYEEYAINYFDGIATITEVDLNDFKKAGCKVPMVNIPFGIDVSKYNPTACKYPNTLFFIGALDWLPNLQGLDWFLKNVWNDIHTKFPQTQFHVAGRNMPDSLKNSGYKGVIFHGEIEDAKTFMQDYNLMIVPLLAGGGMRVKIIEGMAMGKPIITTDKGIEGIECSFGQEVIVKDSTKDFGEAVCSLIQDSNAALSLGQNGRKLVEEHYDIGKILKKLVQFYEERIKSKGQTNA